MDKSQLDMLFVLLQSIEITLISNCLHDEAKLQFLYDQTREALKIVATAHATT
jgi:hypothetical protein